MKRILLSLTVLLIPVMLTGCGAEASKFNHALDADRGAREKMRAAIGNLEELSGLPEEGDEALMAEREALLQSSQEATDIAREDWALAKKLYEELMELPNANPDYLNNYATMLYYQYRLGFDIDLDPAEKALNRALEIEDRKIYQDNLDLILVVQGKKKDENISDRNKELDDIRIRNRELFKMLDQ